MTKEQDGRKVKQVILKIVRSHECSTKPWTEKRVVNSVVAAVVVQFAKMASFSSEPKAGARAPMVHHRAKVCERYLLAKFLAEPRIGLDHEGHLTTNLSLIKVSKQPFM